MVISNVLLPFLEQTGLPFIKKDANFDEVQVKEFPRILAFHFPGIRILR